MTQQVPEASPESSGNTGVPVGLLQRGVSRTPSIPPMTWAAVTAQVAWTLLCHHIRITPDVLRDARDHALLHMDPSTSPAEAADQALATTASFVSIAKHRVPEPAGPDIDRPISAAWRRRLLAGAHTVDTDVLREHYGNSRSLDALARDIPHDRHALESARSILRESIRDILVSDRVPAHQWSAERLDGLLCRIAVYSPGPCPQMSRVLAGAEREHTKRCVVCGRARRLVNADTLGVDDLVLTAPVPWPSTVGDVLVIHLHPDARRVRDALVDELTVPAFPVGDDLLMVDLDDPDEVHRVLLLAAEAGMPSRAHLRAMVVRGCMRWSRHGLLGPLIERGQSRVRTAPWGLVGGLGELPAPLPPPPSARPVWAVVIGLAVLTLLVGLQLIGPAEASSTTLHATFTQARGGVWTELDLPDDALLTLVRQSGRQLDVVLASQHIADKAALAVGDGTYRAHVMGDAVLVVVSEDPIEDLSALVAAADRSSDALADLARRIQARNPSADLAASPLPHYGRGSTGNTP